MFRPFLGHYEGVSITRRSYKIQSFIYQKINYAFTNIKYNGVKRYNNNNPMTCHEGTERGGRDTVLFILQL
jgi:hypothetical protein